MINCSLLGFDFPPSFVLLIWTCAGLSTPSELSPVGRVVVAELGCELNGVGSLLGVELSATSAGLGGVYSTPSSPALKVMMEQYPSEDEANTIVPQGDQVRSVRPV